MELAYKSIIELRELLETGTITQKEIYEYFLERNVKYNPELNAFLYLNEEYRKTEGSLA